jgi:hypothetical protein
MHDHVIAHHEYEAAILPVSLACWTADVEAWEKDPSKPNPFKVTVKSEYNFKIYVSFLNFVL